MILGDVRDKLYQTRERSRHLLANGYSDIPEDATFTNVEQVTSPWIFKMLYLFICDITIIALGIFDILTVELLSQITEKFYNWL